MLFAFLCFAASPTPELLHVLPEIRDGSLYLETESDPQNWMKRSALHFASEKDDVGAMLWLLERAGSQTRAVLQKRDIGGYTPLHVSVSVESTLLLLERGSCSSWAAASGDMPVHVAARRGETRQAAVLLEWTKRGKDKDYCEVRAVPGDVLHAAVASIETVKMLVSWGLPVDGRDAAGRTALHEAAQQGLAATCCLLLELGSNASATDVDLNMPLHFLGKKALNLKPRDRNDTLAILHCLLRHGALVNARNRQLQTPIHFAMDSRDFDLMMGLIDSGGSVNVVDDSGESLIFRANARMLRALAAAGADLTVRRFRNATILHHNGGRVAAKIGLEWFLAQGLAVNATDEFGQTPLHTASNESFALSLLAYGVNASALSTNGRSAMHNCVHLSHKLVLAELLRLGADVEAVDKQGWTPLLLAAAQTNMPERYSFDPSYCGAHRDAIVELLLAGGADVARTRGDGCSALHYAVAGFSLKATQLLVDHGADSLRADLHGQTPFDIACIWRKTNTTISTSRFGEKETTQTADEFVQVLGGKTRACPENVTSIVHCRAGIV